MTKSTSRANLSAEYRAFLSAFPPRFETAIAALDPDSLLEVVLDLGRPAYAVLTTEQVQLGPTEISHAEIAAVVERLGSFGGDNRAGIERTLHRFSAIRNRRGDIIGLTCRVGRSVEGAATIVQDLVESGKSVLFLGRPGVGKTTILREAARLLSVDQGKRVVVVDTSNEIGGDGDIPHSAIGRARRMQVPHPSEQHQVMIEAVENHMPEVIVIDEMGTVLEAEAARTIAERGVQLIATAHGNTLQNLMANPTLNDLVGGIQSVTLGDDEARRRRSQKTVLERQAPPTFDILIEIHDRDEVVIHDDVMAAVDALLLGYSALTEFRTKRADGSIARKKDKAAATPAKQSTPVAATEEGSPPQLRVFSLGVSSAHARGAAKHLGVELVEMDRADEADLILTLKRFYKGRSKPVRAAESSGIPLFVLRANTQEQVENVFMNFVGTRYYQEQLLEQ